ncbi:MAG: biotin transport system substrate-specific component [Chloroflexota bacterium]|jgi:biotin transport system substrate-specific component|nr:biotin transport system substrate-specific component [Chloroflexota bacterium]
MTAQVAPRPRVLADLVPGALVRDVVLVVAAAALTGLAAQVLVRLPFTPVPISLQTFTVLLAGAALGPIRGGMAMLLYLVAGLFGVPWFSEQQSGWEFASFGYIIGFVFAGALVGWLARLGLDRTVPGTIGIMVLGNLVIYVLGVGWLANFLAVDLPTALGFGLWPFLVGDALKIALAAGLLPGAWKLVGDRPGG